MIVITGYALHGISEMCESVKEYFTAKKLEPVTGGFHLMQKQEREVVPISDKLKQTGFEKIAPSHCTGDRSIDVFRKE